VRTEKQSTRKQLVEDARISAQEGRWEDALAINGQIIDRNPKDAEAFNRLGRARLALGQMQEALEAYRSALRADPANLIARRNLQRLDLFAHRPADAPAPAIADDQMPRTAVFIEEVGKTWVDELVNAAPSLELAEVFPGEQVELRSEGNRLVVFRKDGRRLGEVEAKTAERLIELITRGNRYEAFALGISGQSLRIILREVHRVPELVNTVSFPRQITSRAYLRERDLLRARDEADFFMSDEDEDDDDAAPNEPEEDEPLDAETENPLEEAGIHPPDEEESMA
jgi:tetratricopeptide (TPR) repeat protein